MARMPKRWPIYYLLYNTRVLTMMLREEGDEEEDEEWGSAPREALPRRGEELVDWRSPSRLLGPRAVRTSPSRPQN